MLAWKGWYPLLLTWCQLPIFATRLLPSAYGPCVYVRVDVFQQNCFPLLFSPTLNSALDHPTSLGTGLRLVMLFLSGLHKARFGVGSWGGRIIQ